MKKPKQAKPVKAKQAKPGKKTDKPVDKKYGKNNLIGAGGGVRG